ncbi:unnamed protein product [Bursaphelenchus xylophilus]|uniref:(pine wood nematode) hypothetical protein n=1 Tax=Bursaphelenchus xylophilus TaxID=6326 RepID=A0A1I7RNJ7_BURXY|nr:unnamed protein product [Bursaphelenchus xylophilus]CAG9124093.1 unnamed protein product [Bursaphelenchus xylophilus]
MGNIAELSIVDFLIKLIEIDSVTGNEGKLADFLKEYCETLGFEVISQPLESDNQRYNLLIKDKDVCEVDIKYLLNTHLDTVPPFINPRIGDDRVYGRGANDAKGQIASLLFALRQLRDEDHDLSKKCGLLLTLGEETDHIGMSVANKLKLDPDYLIVGEPTDLEFAHAQKGAIELVLTTKGQAAHSGYPEKGESAIDKLLEILWDLRKNEWPKDELLGETTMNIGLINGGHAVNALSEHAEASLKFRVVGLATRLLQEIEKICKGRGEIKVRELNDAVTLSKPPEKYKSKTVCFNTDIPYFDGFRRLKGIYLMGPGSITTAHSRHEFVPISELKEAPIILCDLIYHLEKHGNEKENKQ